MLIIHPRLLITILSGTGYDPVWILSGVERETQVGGGVKRVPDLQLIAETTLAIIQDD